MKSLNNIVSLTLVVVFCLICNNGVNAACNSCMANQALCLNETAFQLCINGERPQDRNEVFNCPPDMVCTALSRICIDRGSYTPACDVTTAQCGTCTDKPFVCISRTQYAQCNKTKLTRNIGTCPNGMVCNTSTGLICVDECTQPECDRETPEPA